MVTPAGEQGDKVHLYHLILFQTGQGPEAIINRRLHQFIQLHLDRVVTTPPEQTDIDMWVESPGGDAHAAYKLMLDLRHRCRYLQAGVVDYAKSAATLLMFGVDKIFMAPAAELGPLDAQIEHPTKEGLIVSALDVADSLESLGRTSIDLAISSGAAIVQYTGLPRLDVLKVVTRHMACFLRPAIEKLDPHLIHQATSQLKIAERYAAILLETRNLPEEEQISQEAAQELVKRLVNEYPTHGFVISPQEAHALGLPVVDARSHPRWAAIKAMYDEFASGKQPSIVRIIKDEALDEKAEKVHLPEGGYDAEVANGKDEEAGTETPSLSSRSGT